MCVCMRVCVFKLFSNSSQLFFHFGFCLLLKVFLKIAGDSSSLSRTSEGKKKAFPPTSQSTN